ncbi:UNVERIFIED_CONTAM: hypothetical protein GTU68_044896 [Idotea baltica]|nr:hypothetical protein [Idotea baltica]
MIILGLKDIIPSATFFTEEETVQRQSTEWTWVIDPLDGTTNYIHGIPFYSISVALMHHDEVVMGIIKDCARSETFYAWQGGGAYLNGRPITVSDTYQLSDAIMATGFPYYDFDRAESYIRALMILMKRSRGIRRFGSAALDLAYVASGRFDAFFEYGLNPWDVAAGILIVREAGGRVTTFSGLGSPIWDKEIVASSSSISNELECLTREIFFTEAGHRIE